MRRPLPFYPFPTRDESRAGVPVLSHRDAQLEHGDGHLQVADPRVEAGGPSSGIADDPQRWQAVGLVAADLAIRDVLGIGPRILGPRK